MEKIAIICFTDYTREPRVLRTIAALQTQYHISVFSNGERIEGVNASTDVLAMNQDVLDRPLSFPFIQKLRSTFHKYVKGYKPGTRLYYERQYWSKERKSLLALLEQGKFKVYIGHGIYTLPLLGKLASGAKVVFNAHEYYPAEFEENEKWRLYTKPYYLYMLQSLGTVNKVFAVTRLIGEQYKTIAPVSVTEVTNATRYYPELKPRPLSDGQIKIVHHGVALRGREIERMIEAVLACPPNITLSLILTLGDALYLRELKERYQTTDRIFFPDPVAVDQIAPMLNQFDIGLFVLPPVNFNWEHALPNKLFEFIQARLCVVISPNPDMKNLVEEYQVGKVAGDYTSRSTTEILQRLTDAEIMQYKAASHQAAAQINAEQTMLTIRQEITNLCAA